MDDRSNRAYRLLKQRIIRGDFEMGEKFVETRLADEIGLSRTPIRAALSRLASEGFLDHEAGRSHRMPSYSVRDVHQVYNCRALVEAEAVRLAAETGVPREVGLVLDGLIAEMEALLSEPEAIDPNVLRRRFLELNHQFHATLYELCGNPYLLRLVQQVTDLPLAIRNYFNFSGLQLRDAHHDHERILAAVRAGEGERAAALVREHIWSARDRMIPTQPDDLDMVANPKAAFSASTSRRRQ